MGLEGREVDTAGNTRAARRWIHWRHPMAGRPILNRMIFDFASRARALQLVDDTEPLDEQAFAYALHEIRDGKSIKTLGQQVNVSRPLVRDWLMRTEDRARMVSLARESSGESHAEDGLAELEGCTDPRMAGLASSRANYRKWLASIRDPKTFAPKPVATAAPISVGSLHLHLMRQTQAAPIAAPPAPAQLEGSREIVVLDAEVVSE